MSNRSDHIFTQFLVVLVLFKIAPSWATTTLLGLYMLLIALVCIDAFLAWRLKRLRELGLRR